MATWTDEPERVKLAFRSIESMLDEIPSLVEDWNTELSIDEQIAWSLEWDNEMSKLRRLAEADAAGRLDRRQSQRVRTLAEQAVRVLPLLERANLQRPDEIVLAAGRVAASS
jgi:hypothetical protein